MSSQTIADLVAHMKCARGASIHEDSPCAPPSLFFRQAVFDADGGSCTLRCTARGSGLDFTRTAPACEDWRPVLPDELDCVVGRCTDVGLDSEL
jgi:hypothetical protein